MHTRPYVVVIGGINLDIQGKCLDSYRAADSNPGRLSILPGGVGRNIAENLARLGVAVELLSVLGDDAAAASLEKSCAGLEIGLSSTLRLKEAASCQYLCLLDSDGRLAGAVAAMEAMDRLLPSHLESWGSLLDQAAILVVDANVPEVSIDWLAERYHGKEGRPLLGLDPVSVAKAPRGRASLSAFDFAKPNRDEAAILAGDSPGSDRSARQRAEALRGRGLGEVFMSLESEGLLAAGSEAWMAVRSPRLAGAFEMRSSSGAGDAACAAIAWGLLGGRDLPSRAALALAASVITCASESTVNPAMDAALLERVAKGIECERLS